MRMIFIFMILYCALFAGTAAAHSYPARRSIAVQAERDALVVLAVWTAPADEGAEIFELASALAARGKKARPALEAKLAARALGPLSITLDGKVAEPSSLRTRLIEDPPRSGRQAIAVLVEIPVRAGAHEAALTLGPTGETTRMNFLDRSAGAVQAAGAVPEGGLVRPGTSFTVLWKETR